MPEITVAAPTTSIGHLHAFPDERIVFELRKGNDTPFTAEDAFAMIESVEVDVPKFYELIDGIIYITMGGASELHQRVVMNLSFFLKAHTRGKGIGTTYPSNINVIVAEETVMRPDIIFVKVSKKDRWKGKKPGHDTFFDGAPDLVVEVLSPSTAKYDTTTKMNAYARAGVEELWGVAPQDKAIDVYALEGNRYASYSRAEGEGAVASKIIDGFSVSVEQVFEEG